MIYIDDDINLDDIWDEINDIYTCVVIHGGLYMGCVVLWLMIFDDIWMKIDDIINEIDDNYTSLIV